MTGLDSKQTNLSQALAYNNNNNITDYTIRLHNKHSTHISVSQGCNHCDKLTDQQSHSRIILVQIRVFSLVFLVVSEVTIPSKRPHMLIALIYSWSAGILLLSAVGYWIRDWRNLQMAVSVPCFLLCVLAYWYVIMR